MLESNSPSKTFLGVRFVLLGFEPINKEKIRSKLVSGGGVDVGQYRQDCTHVIVDKLVYDDPACVAAREDGKMVVTAIWVDHCYDAGVPLDATLVMYRPRKDLNGIPRARNFIMCLTGYQRQDREDIMTMVGLMGAQFTKPLVANKVTHLVCYKFEGEKYELAKKMKRIKLVNHRWLEDCLMEWDILPESNYEKSGYELEMEAEAKDSEDEADGTALKQSWGKSINKSPHDVKMGMPRLLPDATTSRISPNAVKGKDVLRTPVKDNRSSIAAKVDNFDVAGVPGYQRVPAQRVETIGNPTDLNVSTPNSTRVSNDLASTSINVEKSSPSDSKSALSYSRKTPRRTSLSMYSVGNTSNLSRSPGVQLDEFMINDCSNSFLSKIDQLKDTNTSTSAKSPQKGSELFNMELNSTLSLKRKMDNFSATTPKSSLQKTNHDAKPSISGNSFAPASTTKESSFNMKPLPCGIPFVQTVPEQIEKTGEKLQKTSFERLEEPSSDTNGFVVRSVDVVHEKGRKQDKQQDGHHNSKRSEEEVSHSPPQFNLPNEGSNSLTKKPLRQKTVGTKSSGSRSKLCKPANRKGSIYLNEINDVEICLSAEEGKTEQAASFHSDRFEVSPPTLNVEAVKEVVRTDDVATPGVDVEKKVESMGDETEAPDETYDHDFGKTHDRADTIMKEQPIEVQAQISTLNETMLPDVMMSGKATDKVEPEKAESSKNLELEESTCKVDRSTDKTKRKKRLGKTRIKSVLAVKEVDELKEHGKSKAETGIEKQGEVLQLVDETKINTVVELNDMMPSDEIVLEKVTNQAEPEKVDCVKNLDFGESTCKADDLAENKRKGKKRLLGKAKITSSAAVKQLEELKVDGKNLQGTEMKNERRVSGPAGKTKESTILVNKSVKSIGVEKENKPIEGADDSRPGNDNLDKSNKMPKKTEKSNSKLTQGQILSRVRSEPVKFILSGHRFQRKEFQQVIRRLKGKFCRDSHQWSYEATHFIAPDPVRRTEKFFAAAASGRWILKMDYLTACNQAGKFLAEEPYEWYKSGLSEDGAINLEAPRKWRLLRERTGHGALFGMRIIIYGECIAPPLDTLKRAVKAGDGTILATSPPYNRFLNSGVDFAVVSPGMLHVDMWVQEFVRHEIPCVAADYLVEYVCKPGNSLEKHVLYNTQAWAEKSFANLLSRAETVLEDVTYPDDSDGDDVRCQVCGSADRGEVMLICGDESGSVGCGVAKHTDCCDPPLENVPEEVDWFCQKCAGKEIESETSRPSKKKKSASRRK